MNEIWKDIPGYEKNYQVSNLGNIKSIKFNKEIVLKPALSSMNYYIVSLHKDGIKKTHLIHQLIAITFLDHVPCGHKLVIDHINDNKLDNRVENLQIVTARYNTRKTQGKYSSQYKGVNWHKQHQKWQSKINLNGNRKHLGYYENEYEAHLAYQEALKKI